MNKLKIIRKQLGLSGQGLAVKAKLSTATVTAIERWNYVPTAATRERIAAALEVSTNEIWPNVAISDVGVRRCQEKPNETD